MIHYRPFLNSDPPAISTIWRQQPLNNALMQPLTPELLEEVVLSKPYFDRDGFIVAVDGDEPVGFAHAGFGALEDWSGLDVTKGTTALLMTAPRDDRRQIAGELLARGEAYLTGRGATQLFGGSAAWLAPFYLGLYGGSNLPGVLASHQDLCHLFSENDYTGNDYCQCFRCDLTKFRPPVDRELMQVRRQYQLNPAADRPAANWWEACAFAHLDRSWFELTRNATSEVVASCRFWDVEPLASSWGVHTRGLLDSDRLPREPALLLYLLGESLRQLKVHGATLVEVQVPTDRLELAETCRRLGFEPVDRGLLFSKAP